MEKTENEILDPTETVETVETIETETPAPEPTNETPKEPERERRKYNKKSKDDVKDLSKDADDIFKKFEGKNITDLKRNGRQTRQKVEKELKDLDAKNELSAAEKKNIKESYQKAGRVFLSIFDSLQSRLFGYGCDESHERFSLSEQEKNDIIVPLDDLMEDMAKSAKSTFSPMWGLLLVLLVVFTPRILEMLDIKKQKKKERLEKLIEKEMQEKRENQQKAFEAQQDEADNVIQFDPSKVKVSNDGEQ